MVLKILRLKGIVGKKAGEVNRVFKIYIIFQVIFRVTTAQKIRVVQDGGAEECVLTSMETKHSGVKAQSVTGNWFSHVHLI